MINTSRNFKLIEIEFEKNEDDFAFKNFINFLKLIGKNVSKLKIIGKKLNKIHQIPTNQFLKIIEAFPNLSSIEFFNIGFESNAEIKIDIKNELMEKISFFYSKNFNQLEIFDLISSFFNCFNFSCISKKISKTNFENLILNQISKENEEDKEEKHFRKFIFVLK